MFQWLFCYQSVSLQLGTVGENCLSHPTLGVPSKTDQLHQCPKFEWFPYTSLFDFGLGSQKAYLYVSSKKHTFTQSFPSFLIHCPHFPPHPLGPAPFQRHGTMALRGIRRTLRSAQRIAPSAVQGLAEALHATASTARPGELGLMEVPRWDGYPAWLGTSNQPKNVIPSPGPRPVSVSTSWRARSRPSTSLRCLRRPGNRSFAAVCRSCPCCLVAATSHCLLVYMYCFDMAIR